MIQQLDSTGCERWLDVSGLAHLLRTLRIAVHPAKLGIALAGIVLTLVLGGLLDLVWSGVDDDAIRNFTLARQLDEPHEEAEGTSGIFQTWRRHEMRSVHAVLSAVVPPGISCRGVWRNSCNVIYGVWWLASEHILFFIVFGAGFLFIWSLCGGSICRTVAMQFARDEKITWDQGFGYAWDRLFGGFLVAPLVPIGVILVVMLLLALGGMLLRIPILGDLIAGLLFVLAILGGFVVALLLFGLIVGGGLFWPAVAAEDADAFDSFQRGVAYPFTRPLRAVWYAVVSLILASVSWLVIRLFVHAGLAVTRCVVGFGTGPFGWWNRGESDSFVNKLQLLWPAGGPISPFAWPEWSRLAWYEYFSALLIGANVLLVVGLVWAFLVSFYFSAGTVVYFLLRRDVDGIDLEDVALEEAPKNDAKAANTPA